MAEDVFAENFKTPNISGNLMNGLKVGMELAQAKQQMETQREQVAIQKQAVLTNQISLLEPIMKDIVNSSSPTQMKFHQKRYNAMAEKMGAARQDELFEGMVADKENLQPLLQDAFQMLDKHPEMKNEAFSKMLQAGMGYDDVVKFANAMAAMNRPQIAMDQSLRKDTLAFQKDFRDDAIVKKQIERIGGVNQGFELLSTNGPISGEVIKRFAARASGEVGAMTDRDVDQFGGSQALLAKLNQYFTKMESGTLTEPNKKELYNIFNVFRKNAQNTLDARKEGFAKDFAQTMGTSPAEVSKYLNTNLAPLDPAVETKLQQLYGKQTKAPPPGITLETLKASYQENLKKLGNMGLSAADLAKKQGALKARFDEMAAQLGGK